MKPRYRRVVGLALLLAVVMFAGCANSLTTVKENFSQGVANTSFSGEMLKTMEQAADDVRGHKDRYGDEGVSQASLMLAYAYVYSGKAAQGQLLAEDVKKDADVAKLSAATQALLTVVQADANYEEALDLAMVDVSGSFRLIRTYLESAAAAYHEAWDSEALGSQANLRQLFALREADILISGGNLLGVMNGEISRDFYTRAAEGAKLASAIDPALRKELLERADRAQGYLRAPAGDANPAAGNTVQP